MSQEWGGKHKLCYYAIQNYSLGRHARKLFAHANNVNCHLVHAQFWLRMRRAQISTTAQQFACHRIKRTRVCVCVCHSSTDVHADCCLTCARAFDAPTHRHWTSAIDGKLSFRSPHWREINKKKLIKMFENEAAARAQREIKCHTEMPEILELCFFHSHYLNSTIEIFRCSREWQTRQTDVTNSQFDSRIIYLSA